MIGNAVGNGAVEPAPPSHAPASPVAARHRLRLRSFGKPSLPKAVARGLRLLAEPRPTLTPAQRQLRFIAVAQVDHLNGVIAATPNLEKDGRLLLPVRTRLSDHPARTSLPLSVPLRQSRASDRSPLYCRPSSRQVERLPTYRTRLQTEVRFELVGIACPAQSRSGQFTAKTQALELRDRTHRSPS